MRARAFQDAARHGDLDAVSRLVAEGYRVNARDEDGRTALHHAYEALRLDTAKLLIKLGADASLHDKHFVTADAVLTRAGNRYVRTLATCAQSRNLVDADVEPFGINQADTNGDTALHIADYLGHRQAVDRLIELGADPNVANKLGLTPHEYGEVGAAVPELTTLAGLFNPSRARWTGSDWTDPVKARMLYDTLHDLDRKVYVIALDRAASPVGHRRGVLQVAIKLGISASTGALIRVFESKPTKEIAEDYLNSGSSPLEVNAQKWAQARDLRIHYSGVGTAAQWDTF